MGPTQEDVARKAKVSRALVSLVFRDSPNVSPQSRRKVLKAAEQLGYRPNALARSLASKDKRTLGVLVYDVTNPHLSAAYAAIATAAKDSGYDLLVAPGFGAPNDEPGLVNTLLDHQVAGLILLSPAMTAAQLRPLAAARPTVVVGRGAEFPSLDVVTTDEVSAMRMVVDRLNELGHRDIVHISGGRNRPAQDRTTGFTKAMREAGMEARIVNGAFTEEAGRKAALALMETNALPTAIIAANDLVAVGALGALHEAGIRVPRDISVVGFDDSQLAQLEMVQLTSVRQALDEFGETAIELLINRINDPGTHAIRRLLPATLVERRTTGKAPR